jgi:hypothetical protein
MDSQGSNLLKAGGTYAVGGQYAAPLAASTYFGGQGISKRASAQDEAEIAYRKAITDYMGQTQQNANVMSNAGSAFQREYNQAGLGEAQNRAAMAANAPGVMQSRYAQALAGAQGAMRQAQPLGPQQQLQSAAQAAYARNLADTAQGRAMQAQMPGAYTQALGAVHQGEARLGDSADLQRAQTGQNASQMQALHQLRNAQIQRQMQGQMGQAQLGMAKANQAGSEQMMYGQMITAGTNAAMGAGAAYGHMQQGKQDQEKQQALYDQMMQYYKSRQPQGDGTL